MANPTQLDTVSHETKTAVLSHGFETVAVSIGLFAIVLPVISLFFALLPVLPPSALQNSLSHFYYIPIIGDIFVGLMIFIGLLLMFFFHTRGNPVPGWENVRWYETYMIRLAGLAALGVALVPTPSKTPNADLLDGELSRAFFKQGESTLIFDLPDLWRPLGLSIHAISASVMLLLLIYFTACVFTRVQRQSSVTATQGKMVKNPRKLRRDRIYCVLAGIMALSFALIVLNFVPATQGLLFSPESWEALNGTFWAEAAALVSFGCAWLIKSGRVPFLKDT